MAAVAPGDILSVTNPVLDTFTVLNRDQPGDVVGTCPGGPVLADPYSLAFSVWDVHDDDEPPAQVFPATPNTTHAVDLVNDRIGLGHFAAAFTVPSPANTGRWQIRWTLIQTQGDSPRTWRRDFDVLPVVPDQLDGLVYALVADVRDEGVELEVKNRRIGDALARASAQIRNWLGRDFAPRYKSIRVDSLHSPTLPLDEPICAVESIFYDGDNAQLDADLYRVYARHLTQGLLRPDDRDSPKIEFMRRSHRGAIVDVFPMYPLVGGFSDLRGSRGSRAQMLTVNGVFGYTEPELAGSPVGVPPSPIRRATVLLALRELPRAVAEPDMLFDARHGHAIQNQKTREQSIAWTPRPAADGVAPYSGDPDIDTILLTYQRPLSGCGV